MDSHLSLLVVDDSAAERALMAHALGEAFPNADIRQVGQPSQVRRLCEEERFDCVLLDYNMPGHDGLALARHLRAAHPYLPIILTTSVGDEMLVAEALHSGVSDYIPKTRITEAAIRRTVRRAMNDGARMRLIDEQRQELENFAFALAHDFKQPIRQITTFSQMILESFQTGNVTETPQYLAFLSTAAGRLGKLVDVMLQYTLLNEPPELSDVDLNVVVDSVRTSLTPFLTERGAELGVAPANAPRVRGNETLLIQVLQNLVVNGVQYNRSPVPRVELVFRRYRRDWIIEVRDNGVGIEEEYLADIFKPLVRLHTATEFPGTGLGLTVARKAVMVQKGSIRCESVPGRGSVFLLQFHAAQPSEKIAA